MVTSLGYFIGRGITFFIKVTSNHGVLMQIYKVHFYPKNKFQENTEKKMKEYKGMQGYYCKFKYRNV